ncbi:patatin-like phospholipase family protein [Halomonas sp. HK25]|uniref:patatin-like phospholipase family protein n=1 Tax=Halomonas sp. HK25 TaxID=3394321 RepID=UPI0039FBB7F7
MISVGLTHKQIIRDALMVVPDTPRGSSPDPVPDYVESVHGASASDTPQDALHLACRPLIEAERAILSGRRVHYALQPPDDAKTPLTGLALSGGGIRSATFSLGVLQALADADLLKRIDYLSTVSGGGYLGTSLIWWASGKSGETFGVGPTDQAAPGADRFPYATSQGPAESSQWLLDNLRRHGRYLTPGAGITGFSLLSVVLRGSLIQLAFWLPLLVLVLTVLQAFLAQPIMTAVPASLIATPLLPEIRSVSIWLSPVVVGGLQLALVICALGIFYWWLTRSGPEHPPSGLERLLERPHPVIAPLAMLVVVMLLIAWLLTYPAWPGLTALLGVAGMMAVAFAVLAVLYSLITGVVMLAGDRPFVHLLGYDMRRLWETWAGFGAGVIMVLALLGTLPLLSWLLTLSSDSAGKLGGMGAMLLGMAAAGLAFQRTGRLFSDMAPAAQPWRSAAVACSLLLLGMGLLALELSMLLHASGPLAWLILTLVLAAFGWLCNINYITVHRYYRDRLMEAFMPSFSAAAQGLTGPAPNAADALTLSDSLVACDRAPYPLINTNAVLVNAHDVRSRTRGGDGFLLSPLYCGSNSTGWRATRHFMQGRMTLATAMAISGAAANPNTGVGGVGMSRSRLVSITMTLFNLRLGYWVPHPGQLQSRRTHQFWPGLCAILPWGHREDAPFQELTDGGHFENLGLYELMRRRVSLIITCDGSQDQQSRFGTLQLALQRCREDFGARVIFDADEHGEERGTHADGGPLDALIPDDAIRYPSGTRLSRRGFIIGEIRYSDDSRGLLIYIKSTLVPGLPLSLLGYRDSSPTFPDEPTSDQFFNETQFESYRQLGYRIATDLLADADLALAERLAEQVPDVLPLAEQGADARGAAEPWTEGPASGRHPTP